MLKEWSDRVNGYGVLFRFITPLLALLMTVIGTLVLNDLSDIKSEQVKVREELQCSQKDIKTYNENHLWHHAQFELAIEKRLSRIETILEKK